MQLRSLAVTLLAALTTLPLAAQDQGMPQPGPEHQKLAAFAGTWDATIESSGPDGQASTSKGVSEMKLGFGGFWLTDDFQAEFMGMKFQGHGFTGYDPSKGKYVATWIDSMSPSMMTMEGTFDKDGKVLTMQGKGMGMDGKPAEFRNVHTWTDANTMVFEMFQIGEGGKAMPMMKITYVRRAAKVAPGKPGDVPVRK